MSEKNRRRDFLQSIAVSGLAAGAMLPKESAADSSAPLHSSSMITAGDGYVNPSKVLLYECTRKEIREALKAGHLKAAIIPTGATEQHNEHLAMIEDTATSLLISQYAALQLYPRVIVTTPVAVGVSPHWMDRKGTLALKKETFQAVVYDICESLKTHGIKTILIVNGHGGNVAPLKEVVDTYRAKLGITFEACSYWDGISKEFSDKVMETELNEVNAFRSWPGHASEFETAFALAAFPERVRHNVVYNDSEQDPLNESERTKTRKWDKQTFEESKLATPKKGELIIAYCVDWVAKKLQAMIG